MPRLFNAGPIRFRKRSEPLSSLYVIVRLTIAANGNGSASVEFPPTRKNTYQHNVEPTNNFLLFL